MHVAYVTPRYGADVVGGAELGARMFAERLVAELGWRVDVLTTCARDLRTWADELPAGETVEAGVHVHRFVSAAGRAPEFSGYSDRVLARPRHTATADALRWIELQGPHSPALVDAVAASGADLVVFYPYLYEPTVLGLPRVAARAVMHPAAHDEAPIRLPLFRTVFEDARALVFQTHAEQRFVGGLFDVAATPQIVVGLGSDPQAGDPDAARAAVGLGDDPYLLCVGRVDDGKGTGTLARFFAAYKEANPGPSRLVLAGPVADVPPPHRDVLVTGPVDEAVKWGLLRGALALVQPSGYEAFSLVLVEAWHAACPVVVNGRCLATREHCERSGGGLWFDGYASFAAIVDRLQRDEPLRAAMGRAGRQYVEERFTWPAILDRYRRFLEGVAARA